MAIKGQPHDLILEKCLIEQYECFDENGLAYYKTKVDVFSKYSEIKEGYGRRVIGGDDVMILIDDFDQLVVQKLIEGGMAPQDIPAFIADVKAEINAEERHKSVAKAMYYFQNAVGIISDGDKFQFEEID